MRISLKHLLLGMSLGAVVVFIYGINKLTPNATSQGQSEYKTTHTIGDFSESDDLNPQVADLVSWELETQVQFVKLDKYINDPIKEENEKENTSPTPATQPLSPTPEIKTVAVATMETKTYQEQGDNGSSNVISLIEKYAAEYGVDENMMIGIAKCESGFRESAINGPYAGIYQFVSGTWVSNRRAMGLDENIDLRFSAEESIRTAAFKMSRDGFGAWPVCQYKAQGLVASAQ